MQERDVLVQVFGEHLRPQGFRKRASNWYKRSDEIYAVVNVESSHLYDWLFVNVGFTPTSINASEWMPERACQARVRADDLPGIDSEHFFVLRGIERESYTDADVNRSVGILREGVIPAICSIVAATTTVAALAELIEASRHVAILRELRELLEAE